MPLVRDGPRRAELRDDLAAKRQALARARADLPGNAAGAGESARRLARAVALVEGNYPPLVAAARDLGICDDALLPERLDALLRVLDRVLGTLGQVVEDLHSTRVVVIDGDPAAAEAIRSALASPSRDIVVAPTAAGAMAALEDGDASLAIISLALPDMDGRSLLARLREQPATARLPILVLSPTRGAEAECFALGADACFETAVDLDTLAAAASSWMRRAVATARHARLDPLTGLPNRAALLEEFVRVTSRAVRAGEVLSVALLDLDGLRGVNDRHGRSTGNAVIRAFAATTARTLRASDVVGRWGDDELLVLLPGARPDQARTAIEKVTAALRALAIEPEGGGARLEVGFSAGIVDWGPGLTLEAAAADAERRLAQAREARGRGVVAVSRPLGAVRPVAILVGKLGGVLSEGARRLSREGLDSVACGSGAEALDRGARAHAALWIVERRLPDIDGIDLLPMVRRVPGCADVPVILSMERGHEEGVARAFELGADHCLVEPFGPIELMARVRRLLRRGLRPCSTAPGLAPGQLVCAFAGDQLLEFVQMLGINARTGVLSVTSPPFHGKLVLEEGRVVAVEVSWRRTGREAVLELLSFRHGRFEFRNGAPSSPRSRHLAPLEIEAALLDVVKCRDHASSRRAS